MFKNKQSSGGVEEQSLAPDPMTATDEPYSFDSPGGGGFIDDFNGSFDFEDDSAKPDYSSVAGPALAIGGGHTVSHIDSDPSLLSCATAVIDAMLTPF